MLSMLRRAWIHIGWLDGATSVVHIPPAPRVDRLGRTSGPRDSVGGGLSPGDAVAVGPVELSGPPW